MRRSAISVVFVAVVLMTAGAQMGGPDSPVNPYPGGSPFPPGKEPSLSHTVKAFWTTANGMETEIQIDAKGDRPTQYECWEWQEGKEVIVSATISPSCDYHILASGRARNTDEPVRRIVAHGSGYVEVRVYGFKNEDFSDPPVVTVTYKKDDKVVGETSIQAHPIPEKLKKVTGQDAAADADKACR